MQYIFYLGILELYDQSWFAEYSLIFYSANIIHLIFMMNVIVDILNYFQTFKNFIVEDIKLSCLGKKIRI